MWTTTGPFHIEFDGRIAPCLNRDTCTVLRHTESFEVAESVSEQVFTLAAKVKKGRVQKDPFPELPLVQEYWNDSQVAEAVDAMARLAIQYEHPDVRSRMERYAALLCTTVHEDSQDALVIKLMAQQLMAQEYQFREYNYKAKQADLSAMRTLRAWLVYDADAWVHHPASLVRDVCATFSARMESPVLAAEIETLQMVAWMYDGQEAVRRYHVSKMDRHITPCFWQDCPRQHYEHILGAVDQAVMVPDMTPKERKTYRQRIEAKPTMDEVDPRSIEGLLREFTEDRRSVAACAGIVKYLADTLSDQLEEENLVALRDALRAAISERKAMMIHDLALTAPLHQKTKNRSVRTGSWIAKVQDPNVGLLWSLVTESECVPPSLFAAIDQLLVFIGAQPYGLPSMSEFKPWEDTPDQEGYREIVDTMFRGGQYRGYVVVDTEVTDLVPGIGEIIEIAMTFVDKDGRPLDHVTWIAAPEAPHAGMESLHRLPFELVQQGVDQATSAHWVYRLLQGWIPVAHNARFDKGHLDRLLDRFGYAYTGPWIDTMRMFDGWLKASDAPSDAPKHLKAMAAQFHIPFGEQHHAALADTMATGWAFGCLLPSYPFALSFVDPDLDRLRNDIDQVQSVERDELSRKADAQLWSEWMEC